MASFHDVNNSICFGRIMFAFLLYTRYRTALDWCGGISSVCSLLYWLWASSVAAGMLITDFN